MIKKILNNWYDKSFFIARVTIYITLTFVYISLILFPIPIDPNHYCGLCGMTSAAYKRPDGVFVVPVTALKP